MIEQNQEFDCTIQDWPRQRERAVRAGVGPM